MHGEIQDNSGCQCAKAAYFAARGITAYCGNLSCPHCHQPTAHKKYCAAERRLSKMRCLWGSRSFIVRLADTATWNDIVALKTLVASILAQFDRTSCKWYFLHDLPGNKHLHVCVVSWKFHPDNYLGYWDDASCRYIQPRKKPVAYDYAWLVSRFQCLGLGYVRKVVLGDEQYDDAPLDWFRYACRHGDMARHLNEGEKIAGGSGHAFRKRVRRIKCNFGDNTLRQTQMSWRQFLRLYNIHIPVSHSCLTVISDPSSLLFVHSFQGRRAFLLNRGFRCVPEGLKSLVVHPHNMGLHNITARCRSP